MFYGFFPTWHLLMIPVYLLLAICTALGIGLWCAGWVAHFWDVSTILGYVVRVWMYVTPVVYAISIVPEKWRMLYRLNPMTNVIEGFRWAVLGKGSPPDLMLLVSFAVVIPLMISGAYVFKKAERNIVDVA